MFEKHELLFDDSSHQYVLLDRPCLKLESVTTVVKRYVHAFNAPKEAVEYASRHGLSTDSVLKEWTKKRDRASRLGTAVHAEGERIANELSEHNGFFLPPIKDKPAHHGYYNAIRAFFSDNIDMAFGPGPWSEVKVAYPKYGLAGMIDLVARFEGSLAILDFKCVENMDFAGGAKRMYAPLNHFPDKNYWHYATQLRLYNAILRDEYQVDVSRLCLVWIRKNGTYELWPVEDSPALTTKLLDHYKRRRDREQGQPG